MELNKTFIVLIPKVASPSNTKELRPISLCNFAFKLITKILANKLKVHLDKMISKSQHTFVPSRSIFDAIVLTNEIFHSFKNKSGVKGWMDLKFDFDKAYDRVSWTFLSKVMHYMGFSEHWIKMVYECISTVSFQVLLNGSPSRSFCPSRGLRQGDPLSPYLFIMVLEVFSRLIEKHITDKSLAGFSINC